MHVLSRHNENVLDLESRLCHRYFVVVNVLILIGCCLFVCLFLRHTKISKEGVCMLQGLFIVLFIQEEELRYGRPPDTVSL